MRILLTGSRGFTGGHFLEAASFSGHEWIASQSDLRDARALAEELRDQSFTHVVHLAGISFVGNEDERAFYDVNLFGTLNLLKALADLPKKPQKVLIASSANVYGNAAHSPISETTEPAPTNHYATSKLAMEHMSRTFSQQLPLVFVRLFNSTGPRQSKSFLIPKLVHHFNARTPVIELGNLEVEREFNDIRMVCEAYLRLLERGLAGEDYNVCSGSPFRLRSVVDTLIELTGHFPEIVINPKFVRSNEVLSLAGDPSKLHECIGSLPHFSLRDTLRWMLDYESENKSQGTLLSENPPP